MSDARECPFCRADLGPGGAPRAQHLDPEVLLLVLANNPWWRPEAGLCAPCADAFGAAFREAEAHHPGFARGAVPILPTPVRLGAAESRSGRGVTIAFLDSGFYAHPDLVRPRDRILRYVDVNDPARAQARPRAARRVELARDDDVGRGLRERLALAGPLPRPRLGGPPRARQGRHARGASSTTTSGGASSG